MNLRVEWKWCKAFSALFVMMWAISIVEIIALIIIVISLKFCNLWGILTIDVTDAKFSLVSVKLVLKMGT